MIGSMILTSANRYDYYLVDNNVSLENKIFHQCIGIPMDTDCAPLLANLARVQLYEIFAEHKHVKG